jgi:hypothetical protein
MRLALALVLLAPLAAAASPDDEIDITPYKEKMKVLTDGKGHYLAVMPFTISDGPDTGWLFYGDGKTFWAQRRFGGGRSGDQSFDSTFWEPRVDSGWKANFGYRDKKYAVQCDDRKTELQVVPRDEAAKILDEAKFMKTRWKRKAYALARDNSGTYYYVDRAREPEDSKDFRIFRGPKGALKPLKMTNVVSDTEGDIFVTKAGRLRLVLDKRETVWLEGKRQTRLTPLDPGDNHVLIYSELGVYEGEPLGTPCDDL